jgi:hypothetical protein
LLLLLLLLALFLCEGPLVVDRAYLHLRCRIFVQTHAFRIRAFHSSILTASRQNAIIDSIGVGSLAPKNTVIQHFALRRLRVSSPRFCL